MSTSFSDFSPYFLINAIFMPKDIFYQIPYFSYFNAHFKVLMELSILQLFFVS